jgi:hypothetical protein
VNVIIFAIALAIAIAPVIFFRLARAGARRAYLQRALLDFFVEASGGHDLLQAAVDADWVALRLAGLAPDAPVSGLPASTQARVLVLREEVIGAAEHLIRRGLVARLPVAFQSVARNQVVRPPRGLFMLTARGAALVLEQSASHAAAA